MLTHEAPSFRSGWFTDYIKETAEDCGYISKDFPHWIAIDWEETAENCKVDYTEVSFDGTIYYFR